MRYVEVISDVLFWAFTIFAIGVLFGMTIAEERGMILKDPNITAPKIFLWLAMLATISAGVGWTCRRLSK